jgi:hypothetical protein
MKLANSSPPSSSESSPSSVASNNPILPLPLSTRPVPEWAKMSAILPMVTTSRDACVARSRMVGSGGLTA